MFGIGEYVVYGSKGVCQVTDISEVDIPGAEKGRLYYILTPIGDCTAKIYAPTDHQKVVMRKVITREEATQLIEEFPNIERLMVSDDRQREEKYKELMRTCDNRAWVCMVKTLYTRGRERLAQGKKITSLDERYMKAAQNELLSELSLSLGVPRNEMEHYIKEQLQTGA
jgi:CarD family transcriptional regulator